MAESMREAVEGFERERAAGFTMTMMPGVELVEGTDGRGQKCYFAYDGQKCYLAYESREGVSGIRFTRADVLDLLTAANDARQLAIASPKLAEQALQQATRLSDLAERIAMLLEGGE